MPILLRAGVVTQDPKLDRIYPGVERHLSSLDYLARDLPLTTGEPLKEKKPRSFTWSVPMHLDQGQEGRCVEYAICHELLARPVMIAPHVVDDILGGKKIYWPAQQEDAWEGGSYPGADPNYEGTSVLSGMKVASGLGFYVEYRWGLNVNDLALIVGYGGPAVLGINLYTGMIATDQKGFVNISGRIEGGHAILCHSVKIIKRKDGSIDEDESYFWLWNSWGPTWGQNGRCKVRWRDMERLISEEGEVALPVVRKR
jgi:hypothetical protein